MKKLSKTLLATTLTMALLTGCVLENRDDCPVYNAALTFSYTADTADPLMFAAMIDRVEVMVFDADGHPVTSRSVDKAALNKFQGTRLEIPHAGNYRVVCWGNAADNTLISYTTYADSRLNHPALGSQEKITGNDHLYYGVSECRVPQDGAQITGNVPFVGAHINIEIYVKGFGFQHTPATWPVVRASNLMPQYTMGMEDALTAATTYWPVTEYDSRRDMMAAKFQVLRFGDSNPVGVSILDPLDGAVCATIGVEEFMRTNRITVDNRNEATVAIQFDFYDLNATITLPDWLQEQVDPQL